MIALSPRHIVEASFYWTACIAFLASAAEVARALPRVSGYWHRVFIALVALSMVNLAIIAGLFGVAVL